MNNDQAVVGFKLNGALNRYEDGNHIVSSDDDENAINKEGGVAGVPNAFLSSPSSMLKAWYQNTTDVVVNVMAKDPRRKQNKNYHNHSKDSSSSYTLLVNGDDEEPIDEDDTLSGQRRTLMSKSLASNEFQDRAIDPLTSDNMASDDTTFIGLNNENGSGDKEGAPSSTKHCNNIVAADKGTHCHAGPITTHSVDKDARNRLIMAAILCLVCMLAEIVGGLLSNSLTIVTDAAHLLTDLASLVLSIFAIWIAGRSPSKNMNYGWYRAEVIGALISVIMIWLMTGMLIYMAIDRLITQEFEIGIDIMLITASVGVVINIIMGVVLTYGGIAHHHGHGHSHGHHSSKDVETNPDNLEDDHRGSKSLIVRAAFLHVLGDFFHSLGALLTALVIYFAPDWGIVDPLCTFLFSSLVLFTTFSIIKDSLRILMEGRPHDIDFDAVQSFLKSQPGVTMVHNLRIWCVSSSKRALTAHLAIDEKADWRPLIKETASLIKQKFKIQDVTLQIEEYCVEMEFCHSCNNPS